VALQDLEDAARVLQRLVLLRRLAVAEAAAVAAVPDCSPFALEPLRCPARRALHARVLPRRRVVLAFSGSQPEKRPSRSSVSGEVLVDDHRRVRVVLDVLVEQRSCSRM
jgi:hypothetical protein